MDIVLTKPNFINKRIQYMRNLITSIIIIITMVIMFYICYFNQFKGMQIVFIVKFIMIVIIKFKLNKDYLIIYFGNIYYKILICSIDTGIYIIYNSFFNKDSIKFEKLEIIIFTINIVLNTYLMIIKRLKIKTSNLKYFLNKFNIYLILVLFFYFNISLSNNLVRNEENIIYMCVFFLFYILYFISFSKNYFTFYMLDINILALISIKYWFNFSIEKYIFILIDILAFLLIVNWKFDLLLKKNFKKIVIASKIKKTYFINYFISNYIFILKLEPMNIFYNNNIIKNKIIKRWIKKYKYVNVKFFSIFERYKLFKNNKFNIKIIHILLYTLIKKFYKSDLFHLILNFWINIFIIENRDIKDNYLLSRKLWLFIYLIKFNKQLKYYLSLSILLLPNLILYTKIWIDGEIIEYYDIIFLIGIILNIIYMKNLFRKNKKKYNKTISENTKNIDIYFIFLQFIKNLIFMYILTFFYFNTNIVTWLVIIPLIYIICCKTLNTFYILILNFQIGMYYMIFNLINNNLGDKLLYSEYILLKFNIDIDIKNMEFFKKLFKINNLLYVLIILKIVFYLWTKINKIKKNEYFSDLINLSIKYKFFIYILKYQEILFFISFLIIYYTKYKYEIYEKIFFFFNYIIILLFLILKYKNIKFIFKIIFDGLFLFNIFSLMLSYSLTLNKLFNNKFKIIRTLDQFFFHKLTSNTIEKKLINSFIIITIYLFFKIINFVNIKKKDTKLNQKYLNFFFVILFLIINICLNSVFILGQHQNSYILFIIYVIFSLIFFKIKFYYLVKKYQIKKLAKFKSKFIFIYYLYDMKKILPKNDLFKDPKLVKEDHNIIKIYYKNFKREIIQTTINYLYLFTIIYIIFVLLILFYHLINDFFEYDNLSNNRYDLIINILSVSLLKLIFLNKIDIKYTNKENILLDKATLDLIIKYFLNKYSTLNKQISNNEDNDDNNDNFKINIRNELIKTIEFKLTQKKFKYFDLQNNKFKIIYLNQNNSLSTKFKLFYIIKNKYALITLLNFLNKFLKGILFIIWIFINILLEINMCYKFLILLAILLVFAIPLLKNNYLNIEYLTWAIFFFIYYFSKNKDENKDKNNYKVYLLIIVFMLIKNIWIYFKIIKFYLIFYKLNKIKIEINYDKYNKITENLFNFYDFKKKHSFISNSILNHLILFWQIYIIFINFVLLCLIKKKLVNYTFFMHIFKILLIKIVKKKISKKYISIIYWVFNYVIQILFFLLLLNQINTFLEYFYIIMLYLFIMQIDFIYNTKLLVMKNVLYFKNRIKFKLVCKKIYNSLTKYENIIVEILKSDLLCNNKDNFNYKILNILKNEMFGKIIHSIIKLIYNNKVKTLLYSIKRIFNKKKHLKNYNSDLFIFSNIYKRLFDNNFDLIEFVSCSKILLNDIKNKLAYYNEFKDKNLIREKIFNNIKENKAKIEILKSKPFEEVYDNYGSDLNYIEHKIEFTLTDHSYIIIENYKNKIINSYNIIFEISFKLLFKSIIILLKENINFFITFLILLLFFISCFYINFFLIIIFLFINYIDITNFKKKFKIWIIINTVLINIYYFIYAYYKNERYKYIYLMINHLLFELLILNQKIKGDNYKHEKYGNIYSNILRMIDRNNLSILFTQNFFSLKYLKDINNEILNKNKVKAKESAFINSIYINKINNKYKNLDAKINEIKSDYTNKFIDLMSYLNNSFRIISLITKYNNRIDIYKLSFIKRNFSFINIKKGIQMYNINKILLIICLLYFSIFIYINKFYFTLNICTYVMIFFLDIIYDKKNNINWALNNSYTKPKYPKLLLKFNKYKYKFNKNDYKSSWIKLKNFIIDLINKKNIKKIQKRSIFFNPLLIKYVILIIFWLYINIFVFSIFIKFNSFYTNNEYKIKFFYFLNIFFIFLSIIEIKEGIKKKSKYNHKINYDNKYKYILFLCYKHIPFLAEINIILNFISKQTALNIFNWFKLEDIKLSLINSSYKSNFRNYKLFAHSLAWVNKLFGYIFMIIFILLLTLPLISFSKLNPFKVIDKYNQINLKFNFNNNIKFENYNFIFSRLEKFNVNEKYLENEDQKEKYYKKIEVLKDFTKIGKEYFKKVIFNFNFKIDKWKLKELIDDLKSNSQRKLDLTMSIITLKNKYEIKYPIENKKKFIKFLESYYYVMDYNIANFNKTYLLTNINNVLNLLNFGKYEFDENYKNKKERLYLKFEKLGQYHFMKLNFNNKKENISFYLKQDQIIKEVYDKKNIIKLYLFIISFIGLSMIRKNLFDKVDLIWCQEIPRNDNLLKYIYKIEENRDMFNFELEEEHYLKLIDLIRCPEEFKKVTGKLTQSLNKEYYKKN